ncbi:MAG: hypothetical protein LUD27_01935 [Clostridia bacterium]|nr:hypothetical protein [Clostridia bacterium]
MDKKFCNTERQVSFIADGVAKYKLYYPEALMRLTLDDLRTLFRYMLSGIYISQENAEAVIATQSELELIESLADKAVKDATVAYANGYRCEEFYYSKQKKQEIARDNKKLEANIKSAKYTREKIKKRQKLLNEELERSNLTVNELRQIFKITS